MDKKNLRLNIYMCVCVRLGNCFPPPPKKKGKCNSKEHIYKYICVHVRLGNCLPRGKKCNSE